MVNENHTLKTKNYILKYREIWENMWKEYSQIKEFRRPTVIVLVVNIELFTNEILEEYNKGNIVKKTSDLRKKATELFDLDLISTKIRHDLGTIWDIRNYYAHNIIFDKKEDEKFFKQKINSLKCLSEAIPPSVKRDNYDQKFGHVCKWIMDALMEIYIRKKYGEHTFLFKWKKK